MIRKPKRGDWTPAVPLVALLACLMAGGSIFDPSDPWTLTQAVILASVFHIFERLSV